LSVPHYAFVDTSALEAKAFNFSSELFTAFAHACQARNVVLLLPRSTGQEIERHVIDRALEGIHDIAAGFRKAPFLSGWEDWPKLVLGNAFERSARRQARRILAEFWQRFCTEPVDYSKTNLDEVMRWYERGLAPFGDGKKKHEFPDAFAISALLARAKESHSEVAVISLDRDFRRACEQHHELLYFSNIASFTETLLRSDERVAEMRQLLENSRASLEACIWQEFASLMFHPAEDENAEITEAEVIETTRFEANVIAIGENEFTVDYAATLKFSATVTCDDPDTYHRDPDTKDYFALETVTGTVEDAAEVYGVVKLAVEGHGTKILTFEIQPEIVAVRSLPHAHWDND
jgi:hypothetical protein